MVGSLFKVVVTVGAVAMKTISSFVLVEVFDVLVYVSEVLLGMRVKAIPD